MNAEIWFEQLETKLREQMLRKNREAWPPFGVYFNMMVAYKVGMFAVFCSKKVGSELFTCRASLPVLPPTSEARAIMKKFHKKYQCRDGESESTWREYSLLIGEKYEKGR